MPDKRNGNRKDQVHLKNPLERRIKDYSLAAVGIGAVAFAPSAHAAVVTTGLLNIAVITTDPDGTVLSIAGHNIFSINNNTTTFNGNLTYASVTAAPIGPAKIFVAQKGVKHSDTLFAAGQAIPGTASSTSHPKFVDSSSGGGHFGSLGTKYLGFTFTDGSGLHHGWAEIIIGQMGGPHHPYQVTIVQAAYETVAGVALAAGATTDNSTPPATPAPNSLWLMALGAAGLAGLELMRRRRTA
jgi:MYXO-CTERM domain-containing protein